MCGHGGGLKGSSEFGSFIVLCSSKSRGSWGCAIVISCYVIVNHDAPVEALGEKEWHMPRMHSYSCSTVISLIEVFTGI